MKSQKVIKIHYNWYATKTKEHYLVAEVGKDKVASIGLHENCTRATIYHEDGTTIITNNVNMVFAMVNKEKESAYV